MSTLFSQGVIMSLNVSKVSQIVLALSAVAIVSGCQDAVAPIATDAPSRDVPGVLGSKGSKAEREFVKDQYIVVFRDGYNDVDARTQTLIGKTKGKVKNKYKAGIRGFAANITAYEAGVLANDPSVAYIEQDQYVTLGVGRPGSGADGGTTTGKGGKGGKTTTAPPATGVVTQTAPPSWGLDRVDQSALPLSNTYTYNATGSGVNAYIIDSGIRITHAEFGGRATADFSVIADGNGALDCNWHGTHVAGIVGGQTTGVAKAVKLHSVRVLDCMASGTVSGLIAGLDWVTANRVLPAVANVSVVTGSSLAVTDAVNSAVASGVTVVVAAGNNADDACTTSPANAPNALTVGASTSLDAQASFSNYGICVDIMAPGENVTSSFYSNDIDLMPASGTSMSSPHVAGAAALYLQNNPAAAPASVTQAIVGGATAGRLTGLGFGTQNLLLKVQ